MGNGCCTTTGNAVGLGVAFIPAALCMQTKDTCEQFDSGQQTKRPGENKEKGGNETSQRDEARGLLPLAIRPHCRQKQGEEGAREEQGEGLALTPGLVSLVDVSSSGFYFSLCLGRDGEGSARGVE